MLSILLTNLIFLITILKTSKHKVSLAHMDYKKIKKLDHYFITKKLKQRIYK